MSSAFTNNRQPSVDDNTAELERRVNLKEPAYHLCERVIKLKEKKREREREKRKFFVFGKEKIFYLSCQKGNKSPKTTKTKQFTFDLMEPSPHKHHKHHHNHEKEAKAVGSLRFVIITFSDTRTQEDDTSGKVFAISRSFLCERFTTADFCPLTDLDY